jgi:hypothetical protein
VSRFTLQFDIRDVPAFAARYSYEDDARVLAIGRKARERGYYQLAEFIEVCRWKTPRSGPLVALNKADEVRTATRIALGKDSTEHERMHALRDLHGVEWPTASVLLHIAYPDRWPILDVRALHALGVRRRVTYSHRFWEEYAEVYRELLERAGVDGRTFDRGLWQWSREQDVSL